MSWEEIKDARIYSFEKNCIKFIIAGTRKLISISLKYGKGHGYNSTKRYKLVNDKLYKLNNELD